MPVWLSIQVHEGATWVMWGISRLKISKFQNVRSINFIKNNNSISIVFLTCFCDDVSTNISSKCINHQFNSISFQSRNVYRTIIRSVIVYVCSAGESKHFLSVDKEKLSRFTWYYYAKISIIQSWKNTEIECYWHLDPRIVDTCGGRARM